MLGVVGLHGSLECCECAVHFIADGHVDFGTGGPDDNDAVAAVLLLEVADVLTQGFDHVPAGGALLDVGAVEALGVVAVEGGGKGHDGLEFVAHRFNVLFAEHLGVEGALVGVGGINVPRTEDHVVEVGKGHNLTIVQVALVLAAAYADFVVLRHRANGLGQSFTYHEYTRDKSRSDGAKTYDHDT